MLEKNSPHFKWLTRMVVALGNENHLTEGQEVLILILLDTKEKVNEFRSWILTLPTENGGVVTTADEIMNEVSRIGRTEDLRNLTGGIPIL